MFLFVHQGKSQIALSQRPYVAHILESFKMVECNPTNTPMEAQLQLKKEEVEEAWMRYYI